MSDTPARLDRVSEVGIAQTLQIESRRYPAPIWWCSDPLDASTICHCGTCFFVTIGDNRFGITAFHVIAEFLRDRDRFPKTQLMIHNTAIDGWDTRVIDGDEGLDVATFLVSDDEFQAIGTSALHSAPERWPPQPPTEGRGLVFTGYPGVDRRVIDRNSIEFVQSSNGVVLKSLSRNDLEITINPAYLISTNGDPLPAITKDLGGYSGAPVLVVSASLASLFWLGGIVIQQLRAKNEKDNTTVWARRPNCIRADGQLIRSRAALPNPLK
jgi:hypothetical protein